jgi:hypothetical protein
MRNRRFCPSLDMLSSRIAPSGIPWFEPYSPNLTIDIPVVAPNTSPPTAPIPVYDISDPLSDPLPYLLASLEPNTTAQPALPVNPMN